MKPSSPKPKSNAITTASYTKTTSAKHNTAAGDTSAKTKVDVDVNKDGTVEKTTETKEVNDPNGLMNKDTTKTKEKVKTHKDGTTTVEHKKDRERQNR